jgi:branched-subunit amino acid aminotransferase/4-amino-4-deoxychorismate lyase
MAEGRVTTYEATGKGVSPVGRHETLAASSRALPQGAYTTLRTYGGRAVVRLSQHLRRLEESAALQGREGAIDFAATRRALAAALDATGHPESRLRLTFSPPRLFVAVEPFTPLPPRLYEEGVACVTLDVRRDNPHAKDTRFIAAAQEAYGRLPPGVEEGLLVGPDGAVLEGLSSNFFAVLGGTLRTEEERALLGVTRSLVLEVAGGLMPVEPRAVAREDLGRIDEAFVTSVSREVLPVVRIDGRAVGDGRVGPLTRAIMAGLAALVAREAVDLS